MLVPLNRQGVIGARWREENRSLDHYVVVNFTVLSGNSTTLHRPSASMPTDMIVIRVRSRDGLERVTVESPSTVAKFQQAIEEQLQVPVGSQLLSQSQGLLLAKGADLAAQFSDMRNPSSTLASLGIAHGSVVFLSYSGERVVAGPVITRAGAFGKKMTMDDLIARQMRIERQEKPHCRSLSFDRGTANEFQHYVHENLAFSVKRGGFMYGTVTEEGEVLVEFIYEPPQHGSEESLLLLRDTDEEKRVDTIALGLGMRRVGFIFTQTVSQNKRDYTLSTSDIRQAVSLHAESESLNWATAIVKLEVNEDGGADVHFEAFQLSDQCVKLWKEGWFVEDVTDLDPKLSRMSKDVVILGKDSRDVDNDFFLVLVKILDHQVPFDLHLSFAVCLSLPLFTYGSLIYFRLAFPVQSSVGLFSGRGKGFLWATKLCHPWMLLFAPHSSIFLSFSAKWEDNSSLLDRAEDSASIYWLLGRGMEVRELGNSMLFSEGGTAFFLVVQFNRLFRENCESTLKGVNGISPNQCFLRVMLHGKTEILLLSF